MPLRLLASVTGLLGGLVWVVRWLVLDGAAAGDAAYWTGFALLAVALAATGAGLVKAVWLQALVAVAFPVLVWSVLEVVRGDDAWVEGVVGLVLVAVSARGLLRARRARQAEGARQAQAARPRSHAGTHAR